MVVTVGVAVIIDDVIIGFTGVSENVIKVVGLLLTSEMKVESSFDVLTCNEVKADVSDIFKKILVD